MDKSIDFQFVACVRACVRGCDGYFCVQGSFMYLAQLFRYRSAAVVVAIAWIFQPSLAESALSTAFR